MRHGSAEQRDQAQHAAVRERGREPGPRRQGSLADTKDTATRNLLIVNCDDRNYIIVCVVIKYLLVSDELCISKYSVIQ